MPDKLAIAIAITKADTRRPPVENHGLVPGTYGGYTSAQPRIVAERGEIWFTDHDRGFYVVRFSADTWSFVQVPP